jgi:hypothetical protein
MPDRGRDFFFATMSDRLWDPHSPLSNGKWMLLLWETDM